jgi:Z1 domain-containing protein
MNSPSQLPLFGFANPRERLPAFLVPIFGTSSDLWIQDGQGDGLVLRFSPCTLPLEKITTEHAQKQLSARVGDALIYAFQFSNGHIEIGSRSVIRRALSERMNEFQAFPFLIIDILKFIEKLEALPGAIQKAKDRLAMNNPQIAERWAVALNEQEGLKMPSKSAATQRALTIDGRHTQEVLGVLDKDLGKSGTAVALLKASMIIQLAVNPVAGPPAEPSDGLLYGLIQSGKTSILTVSAAMAADNGFDCILVLTTDNDPLYDQTLDRVKAALRCLTILGKKDWKDPARFAKQLQSRPFGIVCSKNGSMLKSLLEAFQKAKAKGLSVLIIDDEADQASLNTFTAKQTGKVSTINKAITDFRDYFPMNTYLQVTATPQALFLQRPGHRYRPSFTVLTEPGAGYVGGDAFFGAGSENLLRDVDINEIALLKASNQPSPSGSLPTGLKKALFTFFVAAAAKVIARPAENFAFLCHVSMGTKDHEYTRLLLDDFKGDTISAFKNKSSAKYKAMEKGIKDACDDLSKTDQSLPPFADILEKIERYMPGSNIKLINAISNDEIKLDSVFNIFVGGNKLGRGVTIKNLLVSYYGRNPKTPRADTVLQHARMYGYRQKDLGVTRLFLPPRLAAHFRSIHEMEKSLRELLKNRDTFEGLYISGDWNATRSNVLDPNTIGYYVEGSSYNPRKPLRTVAAKKTTDWLNEELQKVKDAPPYMTITVKRIMELIEKIELDSEEGSQLWDLKAIRSALEILATRNKTDKAYLVVKRNRDLKAVRSERHGIIQSSEAILAPTDAPTLFMYRANANADGEAEAWWPQLRFPDGNYVLAFSFDW